ncbi:unnamed protein product (macronuclear) [Paramecium tetraurelia]|uniref:Uncharacterized protein n=1 Tax=Paramecium tetraurelia TaxID=5888 RepID=A0CCV2_PARTE|nr:uncharacterized protein GSPATT00037404001 [Paramecium tetraurelia]CAK68619.1 unnamed protein product [Paramecium tetraurelia]|eukprot:XP_001436016.1 hypothetical protein (macronuclear) [Paramecium tetraurelia strain d4-2]
MSDYYSQKGINCHSKLFKSNYFNRLEPLILLFKLTLIILIIITKKASIIFIYYLIAFALEDLNRIDEAIIYFEKAIKKAPENSEFFSNKASALILN